MANLRSYDTIFMGCNKIFKKYMDCIDLNEHENKNPHLYTNDDNFENILNYSNNENKTCRNLHVKAAQCVEKTINRDDWNESMKCYKSKDTGIECLEKMEKSKQNRYNYLQLLLTPRLYNLFWTFECAEKKCIQSKKDWIKCKNKEGETPECIDKEILYQTCIWNQFISKDKIDRFKECWFNGNSTCKEEKNSIKEDLNDLTHNYLESVGFEKYEVVLRGGGFDLYKNVIHPMILVSSYQKKI